VVQICTFVIGSALVGPKFGTASGPFVVADGLGEAAGEVDAWAVGVVCTPPVTWPPPWPRLASTITPKIPRRMTIATATAAGRSQGGRSDSGPLLDGGRATDGLRAGAAMGARGMGAGVGALGGVSTTATPVPRGSAGTVSPGFQTGASTGVQVCCAGGADGAGASAGGGAAGGNVAKGEAGAAVSKVGAGLGASGSAALDSSAGAGCGASIGVQVGGAGGLVALAAGSTGAEGRGGASDHVGTEGAGVAGAAGAGGGGAGAGTGVGGNVIAGIEG